MSTAEGAITRAASQLPQEEGGGDEQRKRGNESFALPDDGSQDGRLDEQNRRQSTARRSWTGMNRSGSGATVPAACQALGRALGLIPPARSTLALGPAL